MALVASASSVLRSTVEWLSYYAAPERNRPYPYDSFRAMVLLWNFTCLINNKTFIERRHCDLL